MTVGHRAGAGARWWPWVTWVAANAVGIALVVLADDDERLVSLGRDHGPSAGEALGVLLVVSGWIVLDVTTVRRWASTRWSGRAMRIAGAVAAAGVLLLVPAVAFGSGWSWIVGATFLAGVQVAAAVSVSPGSPRGRRRPARRPR